MTRWLRSRSRRRAEGEDGFTLIEMTIAMGLLSVVLTLAFGLTSVFFKIDSQVLNQGQAVEKAAAVVNEIRAELESANIVYNPATEGANAGTNSDGTALYSNSTGGFSLRIYTQLNGELVCEQWRLLDNGELETRSWSNFWYDNGDVLPWTVLASGVTNTDSSLPFVLDTGTGYGGQVSSHLIDLTFDVTNGSNNTKPVVVQTSVAARDAEYYPANTGDCANIPTA